MRTGRADRRGTKGPHLSTVPPEPEISFQELVGQLSSPGVFPECPTTVVSVQTHISVVFLLDHVVYKIKKPKRLDFLDFSSLERRRHFCHEEVRLNRRLAPRVYEGVVPILRGRGGVRVSPHVVGPGEATADEEVLEWAVRMVRLPAERTLGALVAQDRIRPSEIEELAETLAGFHEAADRGGAITAAGSWEAVRENHLQNLTQAERFIDKTVSRPVFERLRALSEEELGRHRPLMEQRARDGRPRDLHADLRLEHVYLLSPGMPGYPVGYGDTGPKLHPGSKDEYVVIDCVEFNERLRWGDPVSDIAFLVMELEFVGRADLGSELGRRYFEVSGDAEGGALLPFYTTYREVIRGKVRSLQAYDPLLDREAREKASSKATKHFLRALSRLCPAGDRPGLVIVQGLPGVGKSTLSRALSNIRGFTWIDTDRVRKEIAASPRDGERVGYEAGLYEPRWTERTYVECRRRAKHALLDGARVLVEGSFRRDRHRVAFLDMARSLGLSAVFLDCTVDAAEARERLEARGSGPSDADWSIHERMAAEWERPSPRTAPYVEKLSLDGESGEAVGRAVTLLAQRGLA